MVYGTRCVCLNGLALVSQLTRRCNKQAGREREREKGREREREGDARTEYSERMERGWISTVQFSCTD